MYPMMIVASLGILAIAILMFSTGMGWLEFEDGILASALGAISLLAGKAIAAMRGKRADTPRKPKKIPPVLLVLVVLMLGACPSTYTAAQGGLAVAPYGMDGFSATMTVDAAEVCKLNAKRGTFKVHADSAKRICAAFPKCSWLD